MIFQGAVLKEQGVTFAIVIVKRHVIGFKSKAIEAIQSFQPIFPGIPIILMAQDLRGIPAYYGRKDIAKYMANIPLAVIPWKRYSVN